MEDVDAVRGRNCEERWDGGGEYERRVIDALVIRDDTWACAGSESA